MKISPQGVSFISAHEGFVSKAYRCPAGVVTIGYGFTNGSKVFSELWRVKHGRKLQMGDTITRIEADAALRALLDDEYGAAVNHEIVPQRQSHYDGASSVSFNCGTGSLKWKWGQALKAGNDNEAARLLRTTATTANGRQLPGLVRRRREEAALIENGEYALGKGNASIDSEDVRWCQTQLKALGYTPDEVDDIMGPKTRAAILTFQKDQNLVVDGIVGPATRAALIRAIDAKNGRNATAGGGAVGGGTGAATSGVDPTAIDTTVALDASVNALAWGLGVAAVVLAVVLFIKYRGLITGRRVPT